MKEQTKFFLYVVFLTLAFFIVLQEHSSVNIKLVDIENPRGDMLKINNVELKLRIPRTRDDYINGLAGVSYLPENEGMFFGFETSAKRTFWGLGLEIPIDIIFFDSNKKVIAIYEHVTAEYGAYGSNFLSKYVLETNSGWARRNGIEIGNTFEIY